MLTNCRWVERDRGVRVPFLHPSSQPVSPTPISPAQTARGQTHAASMWRRHQDLCRRCPVNCSCSADLIWENACCLMFEKPWQNISLTCILQVTCHLYYSCITQQDRHLRHVCAHQTCRDYTRTQKEHCLG